MCILKYTTNCIKLFFLNKFNVQLQMYPFVFISRDCATATPPHFERQKIFQNKIKNIREIVDMYLNTFFFYSYHSIFHYRKLFTHILLYIFPISKP